MNYRWRIFGLLGSIVMLVVLALSMHRHEMNKCFEISFVSETLKEDISKMTNDLEHVEILLDGYPIAYDVNSNSLFVSCDLTCGAKFYELEGSLKALDENIILKFKKDVAFENMEDAVKDAHEFTLYAIRGNSYRTYNVIFTTLPIINILGREAGLNDEKRMVYEGVITLWNPHDAETKMRNVKTSNLEWKVRGGSSIALDKKNWKISLKDGSGDNENLSFLNLGSDDDWMLNAMARDDTKLREKFNGELWNAIQKDVETPFFMSQGEYVEVVINNEYVGLYLLQRRIDTKFLKLNEKDLLMKGKSIWNPNTVEEAFEIISKDVVAKEGYELAKPYFNGVATDRINLENWMDVNLVLQFGQMNDNRGNKNMYYIWKQSGPDYQIYFVPWDTDMSWGIVWKNDDFTCDHDLVPETITFYRDKYDELLTIYPDLHERIARRWMELRQTLINTTTLEHMIEEYATTLDNSGALLRDFDKWGYCWEGKDTRTAFVELIKERMRILDSYYLEKE